MVGESGSGKSTLARCIVRLHEPDQGSVEFDGVDVLAAGGTELRAMRRSIQMVYQDPYTSLNPRIRIGSAVAEPALVHGLVEKGSEEDYAADILERVGIRRGDMRRFPHEFSGGQRQRVAIARSLAVKPRLLIADEAVSALDVSIQAQLLSLLEEIRRDLGLTIIFIAHQLAVISRLADRVAIMYLGRIVETGCDRRRLRKPPPPLHPGAARSSSPSRRHPRAQAGGPDRDADGILDPEWLSIPHPLPDRGGDLLRGRPALPGGRLRSRRPLQRLPRPRTGRRGMSERLATARGFIGSSIEELATPALILDLPKVRSNIEEMRRRMETVPAALRPHAKIHKSPVLGQMQIDAGAIGLTTATVWEATAMIEAGIEDILVANQVVGDRKVAELARLGTIGSPIVAVDDVGNAERISEAAVAAGGEVGVLVEIDVGLHRAGVRGVEPAVELAEQVEGLPGLTASRAVRLRGPLHARARPRRADPQSEGRQRAPA